MYAEERRHAIAERAGRDGRVEVAALARDLAVTPETIRRDLTDLERRGVLRRVHGGAIPAASLRSEPALSEKAAARSVEKGRIARAALEHVPAGGSILLDAGTTTGELAARLPDRELTVVTNAVPIAAMLAVRARITVHVVGGRLRGRTQATVDGWAQRALGEWRVDVAFLATNGITVPRGLSTHDPAEAEVKRAMLTAARRRVLLADHTKVGEDQLVAYGKLGDVDLLITDTGLDPDVATDLRRAGPEVVRA